MLFSIVWFTVGASLVVRHGFRRLDSFGGAAKSRVDETRAGAALDENEPRFSRRRRFDLQLQSPRLVVGDGGGGRCIVDNEGC